MLTNVDIGWTVLFNDYSGNKCPALVTRVYSPGVSTSVLDLHVVGVQNNASFARGKIQVTYGVNTVGSWEYSLNREIRIRANDLPTNGQGLIYNSATDIFETENINGGSSLNIDGGTF
jgi:hypothetical protein